MSERESSLQSAIAQVEIAVNVRAPVLLWGAPGIGKTAILEQLAARQNMGFVPISASTRAPEDFSGLPIPRADGVCQEPLSWLSRAIRLATTHAAGCLVLLDEFSNAPPAVQAALLGLVQSRYCGDTKIPMSVAFAAAANPTTLAADGWELPAPTVSRWIHLDWPCPTVQEWGAWLMAQPGTRRWEGGAGAQARGHVVGFLSSRQSLLLSAPAAATTEGRAVPYPCPRSWEAAVRLRAETDVPDIADALTEAAVGPGAATEFGAWLREADLPHPESVLADPAGWQPYAGRADRTLAVVLGVVGAVCQQVSTSRYAAAVRVLVSTAREGQAGVALVGGRHLLAHPDLLYLPEPPELGELEALVDSDLR